MQVELADLGKVYDYGLNSGEYSVGWKMLTEPLPVQKNDVLSQHAFQTLKSNDETELLVRLQDELQTIADVKIKNAGVSMATASYIATSTVGICVATPMLFDKLGFNTWQNVVTSSLVAVTGISPTISGFFSLIVYPWVRKIAGEIAKPFILNKVKSSGDTFLKSEGLLK